MDLGAFLRLGLAEKMNLEGLNEYGME